MEGFLLTFVRGRRKKRRKAVEKYPSCDVLYNKTKAALVRRDK